MGNYRVENLTCSNLDDIINIEKACYGDHHWSRDSFVSELDNPCAKYLVAVDKNNKCVGYIGSWRIFDESHITNVAVHPDYQGKGLGHLLVLSILESCYEDKIKYLTLEVRVSNERAKKLYDSFGFKSLGIRKKYYQDNGEDAIIMWTENIFQEKYKKIFDENRLFVEKRLLNEQKA